ncbi:MAG: DUF975 family protein [Clostridiales bacterium]|jgi:uncharacterized membrane protein|nr:DUF975 family protein [Clostridiales bacterium]
MSIRRQIKKKARENLIWQWPSVACALLVTFFVFLIYSFVLKKLGAYIPNNLKQFLSLSEILKFTVFSTVIAYIMDAFLVPCFGIFIYVYRGEDAGPSRLIGCLFENIFKKASSMFFAKMLAVRWCLVYALGITFIIAFRRFIVGVGGNSRVNLHFIQASLGNLFFVLILITAVIVTYIRLISKMTSISFVRHILTEFPKAGAMKAIEVSIRIAKGYTGQIVFMHLSFVGWYALVFSLTILFSYFGLVPLGFIFSFLVLLYVAPYHITTLAGYYSEILKTAFEWGIVSYVELGEMYSYDDSEEGKVCFGSMESKE